MYEYLAELERWRNFNPLYKNKYKEITNFVEECKSKYKGIDIINEENIQLCKKPIYDIEKYNANLAKRITSEIYELCLSKVKDSIDLNMRIEKVENCVEILYRENEPIIKKQMIDRIDDIVKFINI